MSKTRITPDWVKAFRKAIKQTCPTGWSVINDRGRERVQVEKKVRYSQLIFLIHGQRKTGLMLIKGLRLLPISI